jgi:hypothetical protein
VRRARVDPSGAFELPGISTWATTYGWDLKEDIEGQGGTATLLLIESPAKGPLAVVQAQVRARETTRVDLGPAEGKRLATLKGRLHAGTRPLPGTSLFFSREGERDGGGMASSDAEGRFELPSLQPGSYRLAICLGNPHVCDDFVLAAAKPVVVERAGDPPPLDLDLPAGTLRVTVLDAATGKPIAGARAMARPAKRGAGADLVPGFSAQWGWAAFTDAEGHADMLALLPTEPHEVAAMAEGYAEAQVDGQNPGTGATPPEVVVRLTKK